MRSDRGTLTHDVDGILLLLLLLLLMLLMLMLMLMLMLRPGSTLCPSFTVTVAHALRTRSFVKFAVKATSITIQLIVQPTTPERSVSRTAIRTFGFHTTRCSVTTTKRRIERGCSSTRTRRTTSGLSFDGKCGTGTRVCADNMSGKERVKFGRSNSFRGFLVCLGGVLED